MNLVEQHTSGQCNPPPQQYFPHTFLVPDRESECGGGCVCGWRKEGTTVSRLKSLPNSAMSHRPSPPMDQGKNVCRGVGDEEVGRERDIDLKFTVW